MKTIAIIPAFNEEHNIGEVVRGTLKHVDKVYVIDNNSKDQTAIIAEKAGAIVFPEYEKGAGAATRHGWCVCKELARMGECDIVVTIDGDGQHNPDDIPWLLAPILKNDADVVLGSRFIYRERIPTYRRIGNNLIALLVNLYYHGDWIIDAQCGMRAFGKIAIISMKIEEKGYRLIIESIMKARHIGLRILEIPIQASYRDLDQDSTMHPIVHGVLVLLGILKWRLKLWT